MRKNYFLPNNTLNIQQQKYCRCVLHLVKQNNKQCNKQQKFNKRNTDKCYNPYAVCASKIKKGSRGSKTCFYNFLSKDIPDEEIVKYAYLNYKKINDWGKKKKYGTIYHYVTNKKIPKLRNLLNDWYLQKLSNKKSKTKR